MCDRIWRSTGPKHRKAKKMSILQYSFAILQNGWSRCMFHSPDWSTFMLPPRKQLDQNMSHIEPLHKDILSAEEIDGFINHDIKEIEQRMINPKVKLMKSQ